MRPTTFRIAWLLGLSLVHAPVAGAPSEKAGAAKPTCAVIADTSGAEPPVAEELLARAALLDARLAEGGLVTLLERAELDRVLKEQELAAALGPAGGGERVQLGRLLKADLLVFLRMAPPALAEQPNAQSDEKPAAAGLDVVVSESRTGLRLFAGPMPLSADAEADAGSIADLVTAALGKHREGARVVCAVPPFVSQNLAFRFDHLKGAYARVVEQALLGRPGVIVVELAEAQAIARELAIAGRKKIDRPAPLYLLGEYRHEPAAAGAAGVAPLSTITIELSRGDARIARESGKRLEATAATTFLREAAGRLLTRAGAAGGAAVREVAADDEARRLAARAAAFRRLGYFEEEAALLEAALLLGADDLENRRLAGIAHARLTPARYERGGELTPERVARAAAGNARALEHLEMFFRDAKDLDRFRHPGHRNIEFLFGVLYSWPVGGHPSSEALEAVAAAKRHHFDTFLRIARRRAEAGWGDEIEFALLALIPYADVEQRLELGWEAITALQDFPSAERRAHRLATVGHTIDILASEAGEALLAKLESSGRPEFRRAATRLRKDLAVPREERFAFARGHSELTGADDEHPEVVFEPLEWDFGPGLRAEGKRSFRAAVLPAGDGIDLVWGHNAAYLMKQKGVLRRAWPPVDGNQWIRSPPCFDGRYVWIPVDRADEPPLLVILDPVAERVWEVGAADGLPGAKRGEARYGAEHYLQVAPLGRGRAFVAGHFGQTWFATVEFDPGRKASVKVFHEAREVPERGAEAQWKDTGVAFPPAYMFTVTERPDDPGSARRVIVGRGSPGNAKASAHPLVIDPATLSVEVLQEECALAYDRDNVPPIVVEGGAAYWLARDTKEFRFGVDPFPDLTLWRLAFPGPRRTVAAAKTYPGRPASGVRDKIAFHGARVHVITRRWWAAAGLGRPFRKLRGPIPERRDIDRLIREGFDTIGKWPPEDTEMIEDVYSSNHYGLIARTVRHEEGHLLYRIEFPPMPRQQQQH